LHRFTLEGEKHVRAAQPSSASGDKPGFRFDRSGIVQDGLDKILRERGSMKRAALSLLLIAGLITLPAGAQAHLVNSGLGPFYDGSLHLLLSPGDLLGLIAIALLAGLHGPKTGRLVTMTLPVCWLLAGLVGMQLPAMLDIPWLTMLAFATFGLLIAADVKLPPAAVVMLSALYGVLQGLQNGSALASIGADLTALFGIVMTALVTALLIAAAVVLIHAPWARILIRVAGSWLVAVGVMMLAWLVSGAA
jgi:hydrogenase/urease accessory protein HupE